MTAGLRPGHLARLGRVLLTLAGVLGALCLVVAVLCLATGTRPLVVQSGSMSPEIPTGALAFATATDVDDIAVGDVVSVATGERRVTHRVVTVDVAGDTATLVLKGDANNSPDPEPYVVTDVDRVVLDVPLLGYAVAALSSGVGVFVLGAAACGLLLFAFRPRRGGEGRHRAAERLAVPVVVAAALTATGIGGTGAYFDDTGTVTSAVATHTLARPTSISCAVSGNRRTMTVSVPASDQRYDYVARIQRSNGTQLGGDRAMTEASGTASVNVTGSDFASILTAGTQNATIRVYSVLPGGWISSDYREYAFSADLVIALGVVVYANFTCGSAPPAASCSVINTLTNAADPGSSCTFASASCTPNGNGTQSQLYLAFTGTFNHTAANNYGNNLQLVFNGDLQALGCSDPGISWTAAATTAATGNVTWTPANFPCSNLPAISGTVARNQVYSATTYAGQLYYNRTSVPQSSLSCAK